MLAVSGGVDSMVLMRAAARVARDSVAVVATFDHGTGAVATRAAKLVCEHAASLGLRFVSVRAPRALRGEAEWRSARWQFLRRVAAEAGSPDAPIPVVTAHTRDDQIETVAMRILRGSGARGLAGLYARSDIVRPLIARGRSEVLLYALQHSVPHVDDPSNESRIYLRNRLRRDILPELHRVDPLLDYALLNIARTAAEWRNKVEDLVGSWEMRRVAGDRTEMNIAALTSLGRDELAVIVPALAARAGVTLDRRGTVRLAEFLAESRRGTRIQLSGGHEVERRGDNLIFSHIAAAKDSTTAILTGESQWNGWLFRETRAVGADAWSASLPASESLTVRAWRAGDRMQAGTAVTPRRVKRFLSDVGIAGADRTGWPVVLVGDAIAWIPGVRRGALADPVSPDAEGEGGDRINYVCERIDK